jgi:hypothetical protein
MSTTTEVRFQCRHILAAGHRCGSPALKEEYFCYFHHQNRLPVENLKERRAKQSTFTLWDLEDRASIQLSIAEVLSRLASNELDPKRAGLLLYGLQIASANLPRPKEAPETKRTAEVIEIIDDPIHGPIAPVIDFHKAEHEKTLEEILLEQWHKCDDRPVPVSKTTYWDGNPESTTINLQASDSELSTSDSPIKSHAVRREPVPLLTFVIPKRSRGICLSIEPANKARARKRASARASRSNRHHSNRFIDKIIAASRKNQISLDRRHCV